MTGLWLKTEQEDQEAYRKIFDYQSGNPDREQTNKIQTEKFSVWLLLIDREGCVN